MWPATGNRRGGLQSALRHYRITATTSTPNSRPFFFPGNLDWGSGDRLSKTAWELTLGEAERAERPILTATLEREDGAPVRATIPPGDRIRNEDGNLRLSIYYSSLPSPPNLSHRGSLLEGRSTCCVRRNFADNFEG